MARPGITKGDVRKARDALRGKGQYASIDAIRFEMGNTGSKTTIYRLLKELEAEEAGSPLQTLEGEILHFVEGLAEKLQEQGDARARGLEVAHADQVRRLSEAQARAQREAIAVQQTLDKALLDLAREREARAQAEADVAEQRLEAARLAGELSAATERLAASEGHIASLEQSAQSARASLEHFRLASLQQREQDTREHEAAIGHLRSDLQRERTLVDQHLSEKTALLSERTQLLESLAGVRAELRACTERVHDMTLASNAAQTQLRELDRLREHVQSSQSLIEGLQARAEAAELLTRDLQTQLTAEKSARQVTEKHCADLLSQLPTKATKG